MEISHLLPDELYVEFKVRNIEGELTQQLQQLRDQLNNEKSLGIHPPNRPHDAAYKAPKTEILLCREKILSIQRTVKGLVEEDNINVELCMVSASRLVHLIARLGRMFYSPSVGKKAQDLHKGALELLGILKKYTEKDSGHLGVPSGVDDITVTNVEPNFADDEIEIVNQIVEAARKKSSINRDNSDSIQNRSLAQALEDSMPRSTPSSTQPPPVPRNLQSQIDVVNLSAGIQTANMRQNVTFPDHTSYGLPCYRYFNETPNLRNANVSSLEETRLNSTTNDQEMMISTPVLQTATPRNLGRITAPNRPSGGSGDLGQAVSNPISLERTYTVDKRLESEVTARPSVAACNVGAPPVNYVPRLNFQPEPRFNPGVRQDHHPRLIDQRDMGFRNLVTPEFQSLPHAPFHQRPSFANRAVNLNLSYDGSTNSTSIERFFFRVEHVAVTLGIPRQNLVFEMHFVLRGVALEWYWACMENSQGCLQYDDLKNRMLERFRDRRNDFEIRKLIGSRKQLKSESFLDFYSTIMQMALPLNVPLTEYEIIMYLTDNMSFRLQDRVAGERFGSVTALINKCVSIEDAWNRLANFTSPSAGTSSMNNPGKRVSELEGEMSDLTPYPPDGGNELVQRLEALRFNKPNPSSTPASSKLRSPSGSCWNCKNVGHGFKDCPSKQILHVFCFGCGTPGVYKPDCTKCAENPRRGTMNAGEPRSQQLNPSNKPQETTESAANTDPEFYRLLHQQK